MSYTCYKTRKGQFTCFTGRGKAVAQKARKRARTHRRVGLIERAGKRVGSVLTKGILPKGAVSSKQKTIIGLAALGMLAWGAASAFKVVPPQFNLFNLLRQTPLASLIPAGL